jgi:hypothetical protein
VRPAALLLLAVAGRPSLTRAHAQAGGAPALSAEQRWNEHYDGVEAVMSVILRFFSQQAARH